MKKLWILNSILLCFHFALAQDLETVLELNGKWKFSIGDNAEWSGFLFQDNDWSEINVPGSWEEQGFYGYDGIAWYRKTIHVPPGAKDQNLYLELGYIDDVDEVFVNGVKIGATGSFPPFYKTAYNALRLYLIPRYILNKDKGNTIAVRVFDEHLEGGIVRGNIRLMKEKNPLKLDIDLQGYWKFKIHDNIAWSNLSDYSDWKHIFVPGLWENQGFRDYDGFAWYVIQITPDQNITSEKLVLVLGKIDDIDQLYINGEFIASTGEFLENPHRMHHSIEYTQFRGYYLPKNILKPNIKNTIAVRVYDSGGDGGIYKGPVGIITQEKYIQYWRNRKKMQ